jgi:hypothetical protein
MSVDTQLTTLSAAFDDYPHTLPLKRGEIKSDRVALSFSDIRPANRFFKPMVRELKFDVSEMAIATYVQAKACGKPLVLLPATMMGRFQHGTILCNAARPLTPAELPGKRVGVRAYSQTTAVWVRGILQNDYGADMDRVRWSRSRTVTWPNTASRPLSSGSAATRTCSRCCARASSTPPSTVPTCPTIRHSRA